MREKEEKITKGRKQPLCLRWLWRTLWFVGVSVIMFAGNVQAAGRQTVYAAERKNEKLVRNYIREQFGERYRVIFVEGEKLTFRQLRQRKKRRIVYVEKWISVSRGKGGFTAEGGWLRYNRAVKKGKMVESYLIYDSGSRKPDDVLAVVDNGRLR